MRTFGDRLRASIRLLGARELREKGNVALWIMIVSAAALFGELEGAKAATDPRGVSLNTDNLDAMAIVIAVVLAVAYSRRIQSDKAAGWLAVAIVSGSIVPIDYVLGVAVISLVAGAIAMLSAIASFAVAWSWTTGASAIAGLMLAPALLVFLTSCLAFAVAAGVWQKDSGGLFAIVIVAMVLPMVALSTWVVKHDVTPPEFVRRVVLAFIPPRISLSPWVVGHHLLYIVGMLLLAITISGRTLRRID